MKLVMTDDETFLFKCLLRSANSYTEFGAGGSTLLAASIIKGRVTSVDSSRDWLDKVGEAYKKLSNPAVIRLIHTDIGELGEWGGPKDETSKDKWHHYYSDVWKLDESKDADLYLIDGRFRVACFMQILIHAKPDAIIALHDFRIRPQYLVVQDVAKEVAFADNLSVFTRRGDYADDRARAILSEYAFRGI